MAGYKWDGKPELSDVTEPEPPAPVVPQEQQERCGTNAGYQWHRRHAVPVDEACRVARIDYMRQWRSANRPRKVRPVGVFDPEYCGSNKGYHRHRRNNTTPCGPCRAGHAAVTAEYAARRAA